MNITTFIKEDLASRLMAGQELPAPLTLEGLAEHYQVSAKPVRTAIAELIDEGLIEKGSNRRLSPARLANASGGGIAVKSLASDEQDDFPPPEFPPELSQDRFVEIANDLVRLSLKGEAVYLREEATAKKYDISRSVCRNFMHRLAGEGILDHIPRRGWRLRPFRKEDLESFLEVREVLELKALDLAFDHVEPERVQAFRDANVLSGRSRKKPRVDESLHQYLIEKSGNPYIGDFFKRHGRYYQLLFQWEDHDLRAAEGTIRQHHAICDAMLSHDRHAASAALSHHIRCNHPILDTIVSRDEW
ncbi:putative HTH-type transcriptional regulator YjjM [Planctomycetes bacterium Pan216]|uniref:Putative HTH-type transcriptional regulator YjjM n=1 Tax=Kolteria novifilia TaxID=2527975 RepID=A0A518AZW2_9BACT|nr:putative HTH-type transcriptional regulator YjjM [Planctomycetes bacterium Pan216]